MFEIKWVVNYCFDNWFKFNYLVKNYSKLLKANKESLLNWSRIKVKVPIKFGKFFTI